VVGKRSQVTSYRSQRRTKLETGNSKSGSEFRVSNFDFCARHQSLVTVANVFYHRVMSRLVLLAVPTALFVYASSQPITRLRPDMPSNFVDPPRNASAQQRAREERVAQAYWDCAVTLMQWQYTYGSPLPNKPPDDFQVDTADAVSWQVPPESRLRYWRRLQTLWNSPDAWTTWREWSTRWLTDPLSHGLEGIREYFRNLIQTG
jgi:hypothetical protein